MKEFSMKLPVRPYHINQVYGNPDPKYNQFAIIGHNGTDLMAYHGQPCYAGHDGIVTVEEDDHSGRGVVIITEETYPYKGQQVNYKSIYWHFADWDKEPRYASPVSSGQRVKQGDLIGYCDSTGFSTGDHLHFGLKRILNGENIETDNGYQGAIDPMPFVTDIPQQYPQVPLEVQSVVNKSPSQAWTDLFLAFYKKITGR